MSVFNVSENYFRVVLNKTVHYFQRNKVVDICMDYTESKYGDMIPCVRVYERRYFLWCIPYKTCTLEAVPMRNNQDGIDSVKYLFVKLYDWWMFHKWDEQDENTDS